MTGTQPPSYWEASSRTAGKFPPLDRDIEADVAIIGGGYTGLSAAWHLSKKGRRCVVLEAQGLGYGASGRTGGQVVPRFKSTFPELERAFGRDMALSMHRMAHEAVDRVEATVTELGLECGFRRFGHVTPIQHASDLARFEADCTWLAREAGDTNPRMLASGEVSRVVGSPIYRGGYLEPRGGALHPLEYCLGMANALAARGIAIHAFTPALEWRVESDRVVIRVPRAKVRAQKLILATNAYSDATPAGEALKRRVVPIVSSQIATAPLPPDIRATILPDENTATDAKRLTHYYRVMNDRRMVFGGRAGASNSESPVIFRRLERELLGLFPQLRGIPVEYRWSGRVAVTLDGFPHLGWLREHVAYGMGYNGRGIALSALFGHRLAALIEGEPVDLGPMTSGRFDPIPFHALQVPAKAVAIAGKRFLDAIGV